MISPVARIKHVPEFVVHGDNDATVGVTGSRAMVAEMRKLGVDVTCVEVPSRSHTEVVVPNLPKAFEFLAAKKRAPVATQ
jgi:predicted esterase